MQISGNTILITGGGRGIGRALAEAFHAEGNQVIIAGRGEKALNETVSANPGMKSLTLDMIVRQRYRPLRRADQAGLSRAQCRHPQRRHHACRGAGTWRTGRRRRNRRHKSTRSNSAARFFTPGADGKAECRYHDRLVRPRLRPSGDDPDVLRNQSRHPLLFAIAALSIAEHSRAGAGTVHRMCRRNCSEPDNSPIRMPCR